MSSARTGRSAAPTRKPMHCATGSDPARMAHAKSSRPRQAYPAGTHSGHHLARPKVPFSIASWEKRRKYVHGGANPLAKLKSVDRSRLYDRSQQARIPPKNQHGNGHPAYPDQSSPARELANSTKNRSENCRAPHKFVSQFRSRHNSDGRLWPEFEMSR